MATSGSFYTTYYSTRRIKFEWTLDSQSVENNTSTISYKFRGSGDNDTMWYYCKNGYLNINGERVWTQGSDSKIQLAYGTVLKSGTLTIKHNTDGTKTFSADGGATIFNYGTYQTGSGSWALPQIARQANLTAAPNFTDEDNPTITYNNSAGTAVDSLVAGIFDANGQTAFAGYRDISKTGTSYTFTLSDTERAALRNATPNSNTLDVKFYIRTTIGSNTFYSSLAKTLTITNGNPTLNPTVKDSNTTTVALTGDANKLVKYYSDAAYTIGAAAIKGSSLTSQKVTHNGVSKTTATGTYNDVENASFSFEAKDSRGNTTTKTITKTLINYVKLTCNQSIDINAAGIASVEITGNYFNGSFGTTANTLTVQYRYKLSGGSYGDWTTATASKSGNTYSADVTISGLNYQNTYVFQCRAVDKLATVATEEKTVKSLPVFDWGENDFHVHGDLVVEGSITGNNATSAMSLDDAVDYIIEYGNNGSYAYKKWNSGLLEAGRSAASTVSVTSSNTAGSMYYTDQVSLTTNGYAAQFVSLDEVQVSVNKKGAIGFWIPVVARTSVSGGAASADVFFVNGTKDSTAAIVPQIHFTGRWK